MHTKRYKISDLARNSYPKNAYFSTVLNKNKTKTINEKIKIFTKEEVIDISYFEEWRSVRTLLNENYFKINRNGCSIIDCKYGCYGS